MKKLLIGLVCLTFFCCTKAQTNYTDFTALQGLSSNWVSCFVQDDEGYLWIGTQNGLNRFDGENFLRFYNEIRNENSLVSNWVKVMAKDNKGDIWLGTVGGGLQEFNPRTYSFSRDFSVADKNYPVNVRDILFDNNKLWVITEAGLMVSDSTLTSFKYLTNRKLSKIYKLKNSTYFLTSQAGLYQMNADGSDFRLIDNRNFSSLIQLDDNKFIVRHGKDYFYFTLHNTELELFMSSSNLGAVWGNADMFRFKNSILLPQKEGLFSINLTNTSEKILIRFTEQEEDNAILTYYKDREDNLWVGSQNGFYLIHHYLEYYNKASYMWKNVDTQGAREIIEEGDSLWVASKRGIELWLKNKISPTKIIDKPTLSFLKTRDNQLYVGTDGELGGSEFIHLDLNTRQKKEFDKIEGQSNVKIWKMLEADNKVWMAAQLFFGYYDKNTQQITTIQSLGKHNIEDAIFLDMWLDSKKRLWLASLNGCYRIDDFENLADIKLYNGTEKDGLRSSVVMQLYGDPKNRIWLGTDNGLHLYNEKTEGFKYWGRNEGLTDPKIMAMASSDGNRLWISTISQGLFAFDYGDNKFTNFNQEFGISSNEFLMSSVYCSDSTIMFGTERQLVSFNPKHLVIPEKKVLNFVLNRAYLQTQDTIKTLNLSSRKLILPYNYGNLIFDFDQINYFNPEKTTFSYKVEGLYNRFVDNGKKTFSFVNLSPGNYTIIIRAENPYFKTRDFSIPLRVKRSIYTTFWAWMVYVSILFTVAYFFIKNRKNNFLAKIRIQNLEKINLFKSKLYSEISHELKTPLTLIKGNTKSLRENLSLSNEQKTALKSTEHNASQMLGLINQMLDLASIDANQFKLDYKNHNIIKLLKLSVELFESQAKSRNQTLQFKSELNEFWMQADVQNLRKVLNNLLSNALKFTPENGTIVLNAHVNSNKTFEFSITDSGRGIEPEHLTKVFDRHYRTFDLDHNLGNGIGMALCKELVELMRGTIKVDSQLCEGSTFTINLPIVEVGERQSFLSEEKDSPGEFLETKENDHQDDSKNYRLVIVEDNKEMQDYYRRILSPKYDMVLFNNGKEALKTLPNIACDFILSDVIMPKMDGLEFCKMVKSDWKTSHIPFIIVSGKTTLADKQEGYKLGVDAYLAKPFEEEELMAIIENLLQKSKENADYYKKLVQLETGIDSNNNLLPNDIGFIQKLQTKVLISNDGFSVDQLAKKLNMSRTQLHRKIKSLTQMSTTQYINHIRVEKAKELLTTTQKTVSEIGYEVGFSDSVYFGKVFKKLTQLSPQAYREKK